MEWREICDSGHRLDYLFNKQIEIMFSQMSRTLLVKLTFNGQTSDLSGS